MLQTAYAYACAYAYVSSSEAGEGGSLHRSGVTKRLAALVHARRFADAHHAAADLRVQCGNQESWRLLDDIALIRLEDRVYALADLNNLHTPTADIILAWAYLTNRDAEAASGRAPSHPRASSRGPDRARRTARRRIGLRPPRARSIPVLSPSGAAITRPG